MAAGTDNAGFGGLGGLPTDQTLGRAMQPSEPSPPPPQVHFLTASDVDKNHSRANPTDPEITSLLQGLHGIITRDFVPGPLPVHSHAGVRMQVLQGDQEDDSSRRVSSPRERNLSSYTAPEGMERHACLSQSRDAAARQSPAEEESSGAEQEKPVLDNLPGGETFGSTDMAKSCFFLAEHHIDGDSDNEVLQRFQINPVDLICVKPMDLARVFDEEDCRKNPGRARAQKMDADHVAVEYKPGWELPCWMAFGTDLANWSLTGRDWSMKHSYWVGLAKGRIFLRRMWLIDYRIKRRPPPRSSAADVVRKGRFVFYGNGFRFVEVQRSDDEWECSGRPLEEASTALDWALGLDAMFWDFCEAQYGSLHSLSEPLSSDPVCLKYVDEPSDLQLENRLQWGATVGVLACEECEQ